MRLVYVTVFWKTDHLRTRTEIHVLPVQKHQALDNSYR